MRKNKSSVTPFCICCLCLCICFPSASATLSYRTLNFQRLDKNLKCNKQVLLLFTILFYPKPPCRLSLVSPSPFLLIPIHLLSFLPSRSKFICIMQSLCRALILFVETESSLTRFIESESSNDIYITNLFHFP